MSPIPVIWYLHLKVNPIRGGTSKGLKHYTKPFHCSDSPHTSYKQVNMGLIHVLDKVFRQILRVGLILYHSLYGINYLMCYFTNFFHLYNSSPLKRCSQLGLKDVNKKLHRFRGLIFIVLSAI